MSELFLHLTCGLLVAAMLMNSLRALRLFALAAGVSAIAYFAVAGRGGPVLLWAGLFLLVTAVQLSLMHLRRRRLREMPPEERALLDDILRVEEPAHQRRLIGLLAWRDAEAGEVLIMQGQRDRVPVPAAGVEHVAARRDPPLIYVARGTADILHDGKLVGVCGEGDFLGDMSMVSGESASATVAATGPMRIARIDRASLLEMGRTIPEVGAAFDRALNRGLVAKIVRMNQAAAAKA